MVTYDCHKNSAGQYVLNRIETKTIVVSKEEYNKLANTGLYAFGDACADVWEKHTEPWKYGIDIL